MRDKGRLWIVEKCRASKPSEALGTSGALNRSLRRRADWPTLMTAHGTKRTYPLGRGDVGF